jgi:hypothetical protein
MKAYQMKIVIKNSKPPIWRRCIIPAGITFSQLSIILNKVMGWYGGHLSEYEFYHRRLQLREDYEEFDFTPMWDFDLMDSSKTYINDFMEQEEWFTYTYDFGDQWQHRVTIEKVIEDYPFHYPQVIKFKGDCPIEDCGGIEGYYECFNVIEDPDHPESSERREWAEMQGHGHVYDIDEVNEDLKRTCFVILGKGDMRKQHVIYDDMLLNGKNGLIGSKTAKSKAVKIQAKQRDNSFMEQFTDLVLSHIKSRLEAGDDIKDHFQDLSVDKLLKAEVENYLNENLVSILKQTRLINILSSYSKQDLKELAGIYSLSRISALRKDELAKRLTDTLLMPETMRSAFLLLTDDEMDAFERVIAHEGYYYMHETECETFQKLFILGYIGVTEDMRVDAPEDVIQVFRQVNTEEFISTRKRVSWLLACFAAASYLYGAVPAHVMVKVFNQRKGLHTDKRTLIEDYERILESYKEFILIDDMFIHEELLEDDNYLHLMKHQGDKDYYIPTVDEIKDIARYGFITKEPAIEELTKYFTHQLGMDGAEAKQLGRVIWHEINEGSEMSDIIELINERGICFNKQDDIYEFIHILNNLWNHTRMLINRGFKPIELLGDEKKRPSPGKMPTIVPGSSTAAKLLMEGREHIEKLGFPIDFDSNAKEIPVYSMSSGIDGSIEMKTKKIYPNDPCPCGSGKKYKKCCGR